MPIYQLPRHPQFPDPRLADPSGLIAVGGDLTEARLLNAYATGIFPWYSEGQPILWWSPDPRMVLFTGELHVGRSLRKVLRKRPYRITLDTAFEQVIRACSATPRPGQDGTWLTQDMQSAYIELHAHGHAHSVEAWRDDGQLVGGAYGIAIGRAFAGESMFAHAPDASKIAFVHLVRQLHRWGFPLVDCQMHTSHLERFGAREIARDEFLDRIRVLSGQSGLPGPWNFDDGYEVVQEA